MTREGGVAGVLCKPARYCSPLYGSVETHLEEAGADDGVKLVRRGTHSVDAARRPLSLRAFPAKAGSTFAVGTGFRRCSGIWYE